MADGELGVVEHEFMPTDTDEDRFDGLILGTVENNTGEDEAFLGHYDIGAR